MKLYPPIIEGKISAQSGTELLIPFRFNRSTSVSQVDKIRLKIKTAVTGIEVGPAADSSDFGVDAGGNYKVSFSIASNLLTAGQYYKIQLACVDKNQEVGYFSSVGVFKYTSQPEVKILGFENNSTNLYEYTGQYYNPNDLSEKVASYRFDVKRRSDNTLYASSGELIHDASSDEVTGESKDVYELDLSLQEGEIYEISYKITTVNGLETKSPSYEIMASDVLPIPIEGWLVATNVPESGCISLRFDGGGNAAGQGYGFVISRSDSDSNYTIWRDVSKFSITRGSALRQDLESDYSVEQGKSYRYALQLYQDSGLRSSRILSNVVTAEFEDIFLFDGERQLRVRFNPKMTSLKTDVLESKTDTLGGQYPFFFRNGSTNYKEFPISGLISYWMDEAEEFMSLLELGLEQRITNLETNNIKAEREFKLKVLEWLNNGKPKLFRSPAEGNYIVRLMNVSASPNDTLGRMLHTFSCTAYEIAECSYKNMVKYGFALEQKYDSKVLFIGTENITSASWSKSFTETGGAAFAQLRAVPQNSKFWVKYAGTQAPFSIVIGSTGAYNFSIYDNLIEWISVESFGRGSPQGYLDYGVYETALVENFSEVNNISYSTQSLSFSTNLACGADNTTKIYKTYNNAKLQIGYIYVLRFQAKTIETVYQNGDKYYNNQEYLHEVPTTGHDTLYQVSGKNKYIDGFSGKEISTQIPDYTVKIQFNNEDAPTEIDLSGPKEITYCNLNTITEISVGNGVLVDGMYRQIEYTYSLEITDPIAAELHQAYEEAKVSGESYEDALEALLERLAALGIKGA